MTGQRRPGFRHVRLGDLVRRGGHLAQPGAGALQRALDRGGTGAEHPGDIVGREGQHLPQDEYCPLPGRQVLKAGDEREPQALPEAAITAGSPDSGSPARRESAAAMSRLPPGSAPFPGPGRQGPRAAAAGHAAAGRSGRCTGDLVQPCAHRGPALEPAVGAPGPQVGLLDQVLRVVEGAEHPVAVGQQLAAEQLVLRANSPRPGRACLLCHPQPPSAGRAWPPPNPHRYRCPHPIQTRLPGGKHRWSPPGRPAGAGPRGSPRRPTPPSPSPPSSSPPPPPGRDSFPAAGRSPWPEHEPSRRPAGRRVLVTVRRDNLEAVVKSHSFRPGVSRWRGGRPAAVGHGLPRR